MACLKKSSYTTESGLKYFIIGSFASAILIFGISIIVLVTGHYNFENIKNFLIYTYQLENLFILYIYLGSLLILIAFLFKLAIAPFHTWVSDIYEGIMTPTALFFATVPKISIFIVLTRIIYDVFYYLKIVKILFFQNKDAKIAPIFNTDSNIVAYNFIGFIFIFNVSGIFLIN
jgi:NADH-quinone oxidoreductase subunit N